LVRIISARPRRRSRKKPRGIENEDENEDENEVENEVEVEQTMSKHFERDLENLQSQLLSLSGNVEQMVVKANRALHDRNWNLAQQVIEGDNTIDVNEVRVEDECLKILALHQPVAVDLRRVATTFKVNSDLERIADLAVNIAQRAQALVDMPEFLIPERVDQMAELATTMLREALDALVELDSAAARRVCSADDEMDELNRQVIAELVEQMQANPKLVAAGVHCFSAARHLERIADHATNIAEDVIYLVEGEIARHKRSRLAAM
jgi:phosphate transport system protein